MNEAGDPAPPPTERRASSALAWVAGAAVVAVALVLAWEPPPNPDGAEASLAVPSLPPLPDPAAPRAGSPREDAAAALSPAGASGTELIEVCGVGWVAPDATGTPDRAAVAGDRDVLARQRALLAALRRRDGDVGDAMATVLELHGAGRENPAGTPLQSLGVCLAAATNPSSAADCSAREEDRQHAVALVERLAKLATASSEPRVYALAMQQCQRAQGQGSCALLNVDQWALIDGGNALPWLHVLQRARDRNDPAQVDEALYRIGAAARFESATFALAGRVAELAGTSDVDVVAALLVAVDAVGIAAARVDPYAALMNTCRSPSLTDANRRQACEHAAETLADRSDAPTAVLTGAELGRRVGWRADRVEALRRLAHSSSAMDEASSTTLGRGELPSSCGSARRILASFSRKGRDGEVQALRAWLAANGGAAAFAARVPPQSASASLDGALRPEPDAPLAAASAASAAGLPIVAAMAAAPAAEAAVSTAAAASAPDVAAASATPYSATPPPDR